MSPTKIEWSEETWNPTTGCDRVSPGCAHCYALTLAARMKAMGQPRYQKDGGRASGPGFGVSLHEGALELPLRWKKPRRVFVNSMSDLFHEDVPDDFIDRVFAVMALAPQHTFQVLTKRPERMREYLTTGALGSRWVTVEGQAQNILAAHGTPGYVVDNYSVKLPLRNVWLGVTAENQHWLDRRVPYLLETPAAVRFVSLEPLLGPIDLKARPDKSLCLVCGEAADVHSQEYMGADHWLEAGEDWQAHRFRKDGGLSWVIAGGESAGPQERALVERWREGYGPDAGWEWVPKADRIEWIRSIRDQCVGAGVPFFFKQWGGPRSKSAGRDLDGREWSEYPDAR